MLFVSERESEAQLTEPLNPQPPPLANSRAAANTNTNDSSSMSKNFTSLSEQMPQGTAQPASTGDQSYVEKCVHVLPLCRVSLCINRMLTRACVFCDRVKRMDAQTLIKTLRYVNVILAIMQAFAGFSGIFDLVVLDVTSFLISVYAMYVVSCLSLSFTRSCLLQCCAHSRVDHATHSRALGLMCAFQHLCAPAARVRVPLRIDGADDPPVLWLLVHVPRPRSVPLLVRASTVGFLCPFAQVPGLLTRIMLWFSLALASAL